MNKRRKNKTTDAVTILHHRYIKGDQGRLAAIAEEKVKLSIAEQIYALRQERGLTQEKLADMMGTTQSVISRLENTDYESERLDTLQKLAAALNCRLEVRFISETQTASTTGSKLEDVPHNITWFDGSRSDESYRLELYDESGNLRFQQCA
jgi:transcriptional regulator with XRE-family HTH domain